MDFTARDAATEEVRRRASLLDLVRERVPSLRRSGREWRGPCPIHEGDGYNFSVNPDKGATGLYHCHVCGASGDAFDFVRAVYGLDFVGARAMLADRVGVRLDDPHALPYTPPPAVHRPPAEPTVHPALAALMADGIVPQLPPAVYGAVLEALTVTPDGVTYLRGRGFDPDAASDYGFRSIDGARDWAALGDALAGTFLPGELEAAGLYRTPDDVSESAWSPPWAGRHGALVIPYKRRGECVGLRFRALSATVTPRYLSIRGAAPAEPFNADDLHDCAGRVLHVVEGEFNAYALGLAGHHAIGLGGAGTWRPEWTDALRPAERVVAWYDDDPEREVRGQTVPGAGPAAAERFRARLVERLGRSWVDARLRVVFLPRDSAGVPIDLNDLHLRGALGAYIARYIAPAIR